MSIIGIIPARFHSTRFRGKVLADICGRPMLQLVYEQAKKARLLERVIIACDHPRVEKTAKAFGAEAKRTSPKHNSGTERAAEVVRRLKGVDIVVNIQADEPMIRPEMIDVLARALSKDKSLVMATLRTGIKQVAQLNDPNTVKVVVDKNGFALYFSRSALPCIERARGKPGFSLRGCYKHLGLYAYRRDFLLKFARLRPSFLETTECLEQLRALENGYRIKVLETRFDTIGVDTPEDLQKLKNIISL